MCIMCRCSCNSSLQNLCLKWAHTDTIFHLNDFVHFICCRCILPCCIFIFVWFFCHMTHRDNNCTRWTVAQGVEIWSISLSLMTLITHANVQVPITSRTLLPNADPSGTTKNTTSSSYPATSLTWSLAITNPKGHVHVDHQAWPNAGDSSQVHPVAGPDNPILVWTLVSSCSPGCHCQPVPKLCTLLTSHPLASLALPILS